MSALTLFGDRPVSVIVIVEEVMPFSSEDGESWTDVTGSSRFDGKDGIRIGHSERWCECASQSHERVSHHV